MNFTIKQFLEAALKANVSGLTEGLAFMLEPKAVVKHTGDGDLAFVILPYLDDADFYGQLLVFGVLMESGPVLHYSFTLKKNDKMAFKGEFAVNWNGTVMYAAGISIPEGNATCQDECVFVYKCETTTQGDCVLVHTFTCKTVSGSFDYGKSISCSGDGLAVAILSSSSNKYSGIVQVKKAKDNTLLDWEEKRVHQNGGNPLTNGKLYLSRNGEELSVWDGDDKLPDLELIPDVYSS